MILCSLHPDYDIRKSGEKKESCTSSYLFSFLALSPSQNEGLTFTAPSALSPSSHSVFPAQGNACQKYWKFR